MPSYQLEDVKSGEKFNIEGELPLDVRGKVAAGAYVVRAMSEPAEAELVVEDTAVEPEPAPPVEPEPEPAPPVEPEPEPEPAPPVEPEPEPEPPVELSAPEASQWTVAEADPPGAVEVTVSGDYKLPEGYDLVATIGENPAAPLAQTSRKVTDPFVTTYAWKPGSTLHAALDLVPAGTTSGSVARTDTKTLRIATTEPKVDVTPAPAPETGGSEPRVFVTSDLGGTDKDDAQSMIHALLYANEIDFRGFIWNETGDSTLDPGTHFKAILDAYETDLPNLRKASADYPDRATFGARNGGKGWLYTDKWSSVVSSEKVKPPVQKIIDEANRASPSDPLYILGWGRMHDAAYALRRAPSIVPNVRLITIAGQKQGDGDAYAWLRSAVANDPSYRNLWWIDMAETFRGFYVTSSGSSNPGANLSWVKEKVEGKGALGTLFHRTYCYDLYGSNDGSASVDGLKMGDTPSLLRVVDPTNRDDPGGDNWGGRFVRDSAIGPNIWVDSKASGDRLGSYDGSRTVYQHREASWGDMAKRFDWASGAGGATVSTGSQSTGSETSPETGELPEPPAPSESASSPGDNTSGEVYLSPRFAMEGKRITFEKGSIGASPASEFSCEWLKIDGRDVKHLVSNGGFYPDGPGKVEGVIIHGGTRYAVDGEIYPYLPLLANPLWGDKWNGNGFFAGIPPYPSYGRGESFDSVAALRTRILEMKNTGGTLIVENADFYGQTLYLPKGSYNGLQIVARNLHGVRLTELKTDGASDLTIRGLYTRNLYCIAINGNLWADYCVARNLDFKGSRNGGGKYANNYYGGIKVTRCLFKEDEGNGQWTFDYIGEGQITQNIYAKNTGNTDSFHLNGCYRIHFARNVVSDLMYSHSSSRHADHFQAIKLQDGSEIGELSGSMEYNFFGQSDHPGVQHLSSCVNIGGSGTSTRDFLLHRNIGINKNGYSGISLGGNKKNVRMEENTANDLGMGGAEPGATYAANNLHTVNDQILSEASDGSEIGTHIASQLGGITAILPNYNAHPVTWRNAEPAASHAKKGAGALIEELLLAKKGTARTTPIPSPYV